MWKEGSFVGKITNHFTPTSNPILHFLFMNIIQLKSVSARRNGKILFKNIHWTLKTDEHWAIIGQTGAGKSSFIDMILGDFTVEKGDILYPFLNEIEAQSEDYVEVADYIGVVKFHDSAINYSQFYYQQRFQSSDTEGVLTVRDFLNEDFDSDVSDSDILNLLNIKDLLHYEIVKLSNGQTRKMYIAKALLEQPTILVLDNPFLGLDEEARQVLKNVINALITEGAMQVILICNYIHEIPKNVTDILWVEDFKIKGIFNSRDMSHIQFSNFQLDKKLPAFPQKVTTKPFEMAVQMMNVSVKYGEKYALQNINWTVKRGEKWALLGGNGSGKSTLLSLIYGDHPQAYANDISLFDKKRGSGESIWDIKKRMGYVSPELHLYFTESISNFELVTEGDKNSRLAKQLFQYYDFSHLIHCNFQEMSFGEQRLVLLIRALVQQPDLLILDEPFQGLDSYKIGLSKALLNEFCQDKTLIFVTHYKGEIPEIVTQILHLKEGTIVSD
jgi:molybdate transport system ATP-binding protein